jgi:UDP-glucose 4-epimerase
MARSATRRLVFASSFSVYAWSDILGVLDENSPTEGAPSLYSRDGYTIMKVWQERVVRRLAEEHGWDLTVLRPGFIWGRGRAYVAGAGHQAGPVHLVFGPSGSLPLTHVENCADLFATTAEQDRAVGETFNIVDDYDPSRWHYLGEHLRRSSQSGVRVPVPYTLGLGATYIADWISNRAFGSKGRLPSILVPSRFEARFKRLRFSNRKAREVLEWIPPLNLEECMRRTYDRLERATGVAEARTGRSD